MAKNIITVRAYVDYEIDLSDNDPAWVDVDGLAIDLAEQCLSDDLEKGNVDVGDFSYEVVKTVAEEDNNGNS